MRITYLIASLAIVFSYSSGASAGHWRKWPGHYHGIGECSLDQADFEDEDQEDEGRPMDHGSFHGGHSCTCLLMVSSTVVFRREDTSSWYSCSGWGLYRCDEYCTEMFQDEGIRNRSRQEACDVFGREIYSPWYRRNQVCGHQGPYADTALPVNLCCRRGRPSQECQEDDTDSPPRWDGWSRALETKKPAS